MYIHNINMCPISLEKSTCCTLLEWDIGCIFRPHFLYGFVYPQSEYFSCILCFYDVIAININSAIVLLWSNNAKLWGLIYVNCYFLKFLIMVWLKRQNISVQKCICNFFMAFTHTTSAWFTLNGTQLWKKVRISFSQYHFVYIWNYSRKNILNFK